jgi:hypothetical protein
MSRVNFARVLIAARFKRSPGRVDNFHNRSMRG